MSAAVTIAARAALHTAVAANREALAAVARLSLVERRATDVVVDATAQVAKAQAIVDAAVDDAGAALVRQLSAGAAVIDRIAVTDDAAILQKGRADGCLAAALAAHRRIAEELQGAEAVAADRDKAARAAARAVIVAEIEEVADDLEALEERRRYLRAQIRGAAEIWVHELPTHHIGISSRAIALLADNYVSRNLPDSAPQSPVSVATTKWAAYLPRLLTDPDATLDGRSLRLVPREACAEASGPEAA